MRERLGQALVQTARHDLGHLVTAHAAGRPSSPASRAPASSRAARSAGSGRRAPRPTRSAGASACRARTASRTGCRRCRRGRRSGSSRRLPQPTCRATPVASGNAIVWSPPRITGIAPATAAACTASSSAAQGGSVSPEFISTSPASTTLSSASGSTPQRQVRPRAVVRQVVGHPDGLRAEPRARPVRGAAVERRADDHDVGPRERWRGRPGRRSARRGTSHPGRTYPPSRVIAVLLESDPSARPARLPRHRNVGRGRGLRRSTGTSIIMVICWGQDPTE